MLNKKPRIPSAVNIPEHLSFLQGFRDYLVAQTVSPHTRNAYLSDLIKCSELHTSVSLPQWSSDDIADLLIALTKAGKRNSGMTTLLPPINPLKLVEHCQRIYQNRMLNR